MPPNSSICGFSLAAFAGLRAVAMTLFPVRRATSAMAVPRPDEAPVTSHVLGAIVRCDGTERGCLWGVGDAGSLNGNWLMLRIIRGRKDVGDLFLAFRCASGF